jgi:hypothetical protein
VTGEIGPLTGRVLEYTQTMERLVAAVGDTPEWAELAGYVAVEQFERVGTFLEVQNWPEYTEMLTRWASSIDSFETVVRRTSELADLVYFEIEERHRRAEHVSVVNSMTVFEFDQDERIRHLDVYLQQPR